MNTNNHIFEIKRLMNGQGWSHITNQEYNSLDYFTQEWIKDTLAVEDGEGFDSHVHSITLGNSTMYFVDEQEEGQF